jgi:hypothetical protein
VKHQRFVMAGGAAAVAGTCAFALVAQAGDDKHQPPAAKIEFARGTSDLMTSTIVAALVQEINETTPANVPQGNLSIGLIFNDKNRDMRLVGTLQPLSANDLPADDFEKRALAAAMKGNPLTAVEKIGGDWYYRRSNPLTNFKPQCAMCHASYAGLAATAPVGALMLRIPIAAK